MRFLSSDVLPRLYWHAAIASQRLGISGVIAIGVLIFGLIFYLASIRLSERDLQSLNGQLSAKSLASQVSACQDARRTIADV
jgi:hypothetical protein